MFGHDSKPSRIFSYGARPPGENQELVLQQMRAGHNYRNKLVEIELTRRDRLARKQRELFPEVDRLQTAIEVAAGSLQGLLDTIKQQNKHARRRTGTPEQRKQAAALRQSIKELKQSLRDVRERVKNDSGWEQAQKIINDESNEQQREARRASGLYWANYLIVDQASASMRTGAPPKFHRWTGEGRIAVQLQGGLASDEAFSGKSTLLRIDPLPEGTFDRRTVPHANKRTTAWVRVGSQDRQPVWCTLPVWLHRPLPEDGRIKWVYLHRRKLGTKWQWTLSLVVEREAGYSRSDCATDGMVAVDPGWRLVEAGLRVAYWVGSDGQEDELVIPPERLAQWKKTEDLRSIRDKNLDAIRGRLADWLDANDVPEWLSERAKTLRKWRSTARLAAVVLDWRDRRFAGDEEIFPELEAWRIQDKHLYEWEANQRGKAAHWRDWFYRNVAASLRRQYRMLVVEDCDWSELQRGTPTEAAESTDGARAYQRIAAVGRLVQILREGLSEAMRVDARLTTQACHLCGNTERWDAAASLWHTCTQCGARWDQDYNACRNLLERASGPALAEPAGALE